MPLDVLADDAESIKTPPALDEVDPDDAVADALAAPLDPRPALGALDAEDALTAAALEPRPHGRMIKNIKIIQTI